MPRTIVAAAMIAAACTATFGAAPEPSPATEPIISNVFHENDPNTNRGFPDCDSNGIDDAIDAVTDFNSRDIGFGVHSECYRYEVTTVGSDFDTEIAIFDEFGNFVATNDDIEPGNLQSRLYETLFNAQFSDFTSDFQAGGIRINQSGCSTSGLTTVTIGAGTGTGSLASGRVVLQPFTGVPGTQPCNPADLATPFQILDLADINAFVAGFTSQSPAGDLNSNGIWDLTDINLFVTAFTSGCP